MSNEPIKPIKLTLVDDRDVITPGDDGDDAGQAGGDQASDRAGPEKAHAASDHATRPAYNFPDPRLTVAYFGVAFGFLGIFTSAAIFTPLGLLCAAIALFQGHGSWAFVGFLLGFAGIVTSPIFMGLLGLGSVSLFLMAL